MTPEDTPPDPDNPPEPPRFPPGPPKKKPTPPAPPPPALINPKPGSVQLTPMMDFLQRRLEKMERELESERSRAQSAQNLLEQQDSLRGEVETQLKALSKQFRRDKNEREGEEMRSHAQGRIDSLEKRLDEMHQTWASLLQESVLKPGAHDSKALLERLSAIEADLQSVPQALREVRNLSNRIPADDQRFEAELTRMLTEFSASIKDQLASLARQQAVELERQEERVQALARERATLSEAWESQKHDLRQSLLKEGLAREKEVKESLDTIAATTESTRQETEKRNAEITALVTRVVERIEATPQAKEEIILDLEREISDLRKGLKDRTNDLRDYSNERRQIEQSLGASLLDLNRELELEREKSRTAARQVGELENAALKARDETLAAIRIGEDKDARHTALSAERDALTRSLVAETEKVREQIDGLRKAEEEWSKRYAEVEEKLRGEVEHRLREVSASEDLRSQIATLTSQMTKAIQEKEALQIRYQSWEQERKVAQTALEKKEEMISLLSHTFQKLIKKPD